MPHGFAHRSFARRAVLRKGRAARRLRCSGGFDCACCITLRYAGSHVVRGARRREWRRSGNWAFPDGAQARGAFSSCLRKSCCGPMAVLLRSYCPQQSYRPTVPLSRCPAVLSSCCPIALPSYCRNPPATLWQFQRLRNGAKSPMFTHLGARAERMRFARNECSALGRLSRRKGSISTILCQTKGRRRALTDVVPNERPSAYTDGLGGVLGGGVGCESAPFALAQRNGEESCGVLLQQGGDLADERLEAHTARLELRLLARDDHGIVREVAGERHGFAQRAARHDGG